MPSTATANGASSSAAQKLPVTLQLASMGLYGRMQRRLLRGAGTTVPLRRAVSMAYAAHSMSMTLPGGPLISTVYNYRRMRGFGADSVVAAWATAASGVLSAIGLAVLGVGVGVLAAAAGFWYLALAAPERRMDVLGLASLCAAVLTARAARAAPSHSAIDGMSPGASRRCSSATKV